MPELPPPQIAQFRAAIACVAFRYSSVGYSDVTGYLAVLALAGITPPVANFCSLPRPDSRLLLFDQ